MTSLDLFFNPTSVAIIGASRTPGEVGYEILKNVKNTFQGQIYPVNPEVAELQGLTTYSSILNIPEPVELAIIATPANDVPKIMKECVKKKVKASIIVSAGFSEIGRKKLEDEILAAVKNSGMRVIGPNCLGIYTKTLDTLFLPKERLKRPPEGFISFITQSGAVGATIMDRIADEGVGINKFISIGNRIDIDEIDLLEYLGKDLQTRCIVMYLESTERGKELIDLARKIVPDKPIIVLKAGKTEEGMEAIVTHTGHLAVPARVYSAAFHQAGIIEAQTTDELFDYARVLANQPILKNKRIAIVTDGGGFGILAADEAIRRGLKIPELSKETTKALKKLPPYVPRRNPLDLTGDATTERYRMALESLFKDKTIDGIVCIALLQIPTLEEKVIQVIRESKLYPKPITVCMTGSEFTRRHAARLESYGIPVYATPERAVRAMKILYEYGRIIKGK